MLTKLVHPDQTCFIKGRYVGENVRLISDIMKQTRVNNTPGILISVDFKKAFDSLECSCNVFKVLSKNSILVTA